MRDTAQQQGGQWKEIWRVYQVNPRNTGGGERGKDLSPGMRRR